MDALAIALAQSYRQRPQFGQLLLQGMGLLTQPMETGQARAALEGVQAAQQFVYRRLGCGRPAGQRFIHAGQQVLGFLDEDLEDFRVGIFIEDRRGRHQSGRGFTCRLRLSAVVTQGLDKVLGCRRGLPLGQGFELLMQSVVAAVQQTAQFGTWLDSPSRQSLIEGFQGMGEIADGIHLSQASPTLQGVQVAQQRFQFQAVARLGFPGT